MRAVYIGDTQRYDVAGPRRGLLQPIHFDPYALCPSCGRHDAQIIASLDELMTI